MIRTVGSSYIVVTAFLSSDSVTPTIVTVISDLSHSVRLRSSPTTFVDPNSFIASSSLITQTGLPLSASLSVYAAPFTNVLSSNVNADASVAITEAENSSFLVRVVPSSTICVVTALMPSIFAMASISSSVI